MMLIEQTSVPLSALPLAELRDHLRLGTGFGNENLQDDVLETCLRAALASIEARTGKALIEKEYLLSLTAWKGLDFHPLPIAPVSVLQSVETVDGSGSVTTIDSGAYRLRKDNLVPKIIADGALPRVPVNGTVEIVLTAGFGPDWSDLPDDLYRAVLVLAASNYESRYGYSGGSSNMPGEVESLIERYRTLRLSRGAVG